MKLKAKTPVVQDATPEVTYDHYWLSQMVIAAPSPDQEAVVMARLTPAVDVEGRKILKTDGHLDVHINEVFSKIDADPTGPLAQAFGVVLMALIAEVPELEAE